jgi:hypothetical protein
MTTKVAIRRQMVNDAMIYFSDFNFVTLLIYGSYGNDVQPCMWSGTPYSVYIRDEQKSL